MIDENTAALYRAKPYVPAKLHTPRGDTVSRFLVGEIFKFSDVITSRRMRAGVAGVDNSAQPVKTIADMPVTTWSE